MGDTAAATETRERAIAENWARIAADSYAAIALMHAGNNGPEHRAKVREAQERALARGSDLL